MIVATSSGPSRSPARYADSGDKGLLQAGPGRSKIAALEPESVSVVITEFRLVTHMKTFHAIVPVLVTVFAANAAASDPKPIEGGYSNGEVLKLIVDGRKAYLVRPTKALDQARRWIWVAPSYLELADQNGKVGIEPTWTDFWEQDFTSPASTSGATCGSPRGAEIYQKFYEHLTTNEKLNPKARLLGQSNGGLISYAWAFRHPNLVDRIGGIYPATDFRTWPGLAKVVEYPEPAPRFGLSLEELGKRAALFNPIDNLAPLAKAGVKIFHIHGDKDKLVPCEANSALLVEKYKRLGGDARLEIVPGLGHGGAPFYNSESLVKFLIE